MEGDRSFAASTIIDFGVSSMMLAGETESGDLHLVHAIEGGVLVAVVDALGHGSEAATAAARAIAAAKVYGHEPVLSVLKRCHAALAGGRGVVMNLAAFDVGTRTMTWIGVGNVEGFLLPTGTGTGMRQSLVTRGGIVGSELPPARPNTLVIASGDTLIFATDGIRADFADTVSVAGSPQQVADRILAQSGKGTDDALVLVARVNWPDP